MTADRDPERVPRPDAIDCGTPEDCDWWTYADTDEYVSCWTPGCGAEAKT